MDDFRWTPASEKAAQLVADGNLTYTEIARSIPVDVATLWRWRQTESFKARIEENLDEIRAEIRRIGIADLHRRVGALNDRWNRMRRVIEARADDPSMADVPGGTTGLMVRTVKRIVVEDDTQAGDGKTTSREIDEFAVDTALLKELRDHEKQAAQELGQWSDKQQISGPDGGPLVVFKLGGPASMDDI